MFVVHFLIKQSEKGAKKTVEQHYKNTEIIKFLNFTHINNLKRKIYMSSNRAVKTSKDTYTDIRFLFL